MGYRSVSLLMESVMKYINLLQQRVADLESELEAMWQWKAELLAHLESDKFKGLDSDGSRKDWISTQDVRERLRQLNV